MDDLARPVKAFQFEGKGFDLLFLTLKNIFLSIVTLGIYIPYAKTENRKFLWNNTKFDNSYFAYTGKGIELLKGYAIAFGVIMGGNFAIQIVSRMNPIAGPILFFIYIGTLFFFVPGILYGSHRYKLTRTSFRGINFYASKKGKSEFRWYYFKGLFLTIITLGIYFPWYKNNLLKIRWDNSSYGNLKFEYKGEGKEMLILYLKLIAFAPLTFGLYTFWWLAEVARYKAQCLYLNGNHFELDFEGSDAFALYLVNAVITIFTFGIGTPWALLYSISYVLKRASYIGEIDYNSINQSQDFSKGDIANEGFGDALDFDFGV